MGNSRSREIRLKNGKLFSVPAPAVKYLLRDLPHYKGNVNALNKKTTAYSKAVTQAQISDILLGKTEDGSCFLSEEEQTVFRRGRNSKSVSIPKSCTPSEYRKATGFEALIGYLYLQDRKERIMEIVTYRIDKYQENK